MLQGDGTTLAEGFVAFAILSAPALTTSLGAASMGTVPSLGASMGTLDGVASVLVFFQHGHGPSVLYELHCAFYQTVLLHQQGQGPYDF